MKELTIQEIKDVQLELLKSLDAFCTEHHISYSLAYGTLIGAVRHQGYIPWDDDIDVFLLRSDYDQLIQYFLDTAQYGFASLESDVRWNRPYAKFYDKRTLCVELASNNTGIGLGIDVFPVDQIPEDVAERNAYRRKLFMLRNVYLLKSLAWSKNRALIRNILAALGHVILAPFSYRFLAQCISRYSQKYNQRDNCLLSDNTSGYPEAAPYMKTSFAKMVRMPFEDTTAMVAQGYDDILTKDFGDYMKLPPVEKQVSHHSINVYWK